ncbi:MAG: hypothetical protein RR891_06085 [Clostridium sp.]
MIIDRVRYKELKKEAGGIRKLECSITAQILEAPDLKKANICSVYVYTNGLYLSFIWSYKLYFPMTDFKKVTYDNNIVEIHLADGKMISMKIEKEEALLKLDRVLREHLGFITEKLNFNREKVFKDEVERDRKSREREIKKEEKRKEKEAVDILKGKKAELLLRNQYIVNEDSNVARCPKCGSTSITANKKGFSLAKGALGVATVGAYGVLAAGHGKNKVLVTCLKCGHQWKPGK